MKKLYLIRGVSGSGKTTLAKEMYDAFRAANIRAIEVAADDYFMVDGEYNFDSNKLGAAHEWCRELVADGMRYDEYEAIIIHNTFTTEKEMKHYLELSEMYDYDVTTLVVENRHGNGSVHDVPDETLKRQRNRLRNTIQL